MIATVHGGSMEELRRKPVFDKMLKERRFERYILLGNQQHVGEVQAIYDENAEEIGRC